MSPPTLAQVIACAEAGADIVRISTPDESSTVRYAKSCGEALCLSSPEHPFPL